MLTFKDIHFSYGGDNSFSLKVNHLTIHPHQYIYVIGPSGSGKSTLLQLIGGIIKPQQGEIIKHSNPRIVYLSQEPCLWSHMSVKEHINLVLNRCCRKKEHPQTAFYLDTFGLTQYASLLPDALSGGLKQRLALAQAVASKPDLLLLDEPFSSIDPINAKKLSDTLYHLHNSQLFGVVEISHYLFHFKLNSRILLVENGVVENFDSIETINESSEWKKEFKKFINLKD